MTKLSGQSHNPQEELLQLLQKKFPEIFTEGKVNPEKLKATLGDEVNMDLERYNLSWAGKSDCFRHIQSPVTKTLKPDRSESVNFDETQNIFIEGDNLEVLKVLQKSYYGKVKMIYIDPPYNTGSDSFIYPDKFEETAEEYLERIGEKEEGILTKDGMFQKNSKDNGHYHSNWLSMMYPRLFLARNLMRDDGVIFVSIDDNEVHNLRMVMNEIFGEENFVGQLIHKNNSSKNQAKLLSISTEYILCFGKNLDILKQNEWRIKKAGTKDVAKLFEKLKTQGLTLEEIESEIKDLYKRPKYSHLSRWNKVDEKGVFKDSDLSREGGAKNYTIKNPKTNKDCIIPDRGWGKSYEELLRLQDQDLIWYGDENTPPGVKDYIGVDDVSVPDNFWYFDNSVDTRWIKQAFDCLIFENPKPLEMIKQLLEMVTADDDLILDFFAGSGTTAHAVMALNAEDGGNRKCISVQLPEPCEEKSEAYKAGYRTIADIAKERVCRAGKKMLEEIKETPPNLPLSGEAKSPPDKGDLGGLDIGFKVLKLDESNFKIWQGNITTEEDLIKQMEMFVDNVKLETTQENILYELILKSGLDLNIKVEKKETDKKQYFVLGDNALIVCLEDSLSQELLHTIISSHPQKVIVLDKGFDNDDQLKTNTLLQAEDEGVEFKVI